MSKKEMKKKSEAFGTDPFGSSHLSDKVRTSPFGAVGGDSHSGILEPSDGSLGHPNDYFSESDKTETLEERLVLLRKKREKLKKRKLKNKKIKKAQWGHSGVKLPENSSGNWVMDTYKNIINNNTPNQTERPQTGIEKENTIESTLRSSVTINSISDKSSEIGSGFFINEMAILTCAHVVMPDGYIQNTKINVKYNNEEYPAYIWAYDNILDIAILVINKENFQSENYIELSNSSEAELGTEIVIVGNPLGFENVIGKGIISSGDVDYQESGANIPYMFLSTNILPGNSGGPVVREDNGAVIGMVAAIISDEKSTGGDGLSAMIPIDKIKPFLKENGIKFNFKR